MEDDSSIIVVVVVVVIVLAIAALLFWYFGGGTFDQTVVYRFTDKGTSTYVGENFTAYTSNATSSGITLKVTPPVDPVGKQFIIDNSVGVGTVTIDTSVAVGGQTVTTTTTPPVSYGPNKIRQKSVAMFVWNTSSTLLRVS